MKFRTCKASTVDWLQEFYKEAGYTGEVKEEDVLYYVSDNESILGVVRIALENDVRVLRGMQVVKARRGEGIGSKLLNYLDSTLDSRPVLCIPFDHLVKFYGNIGFKVIEASQAPDFLVNRLNAYLSKDRKVLLMARGYAT